MKLSPKQIAILSACIAAVLVIAIVLMVIFIPKCNTDDTSETTTGGPSSPPDNTTPSDDSGSLLFELSADGTSYFISGTLSDYIQSVTIPATYRDLPVTAIASSSFYYCDALTSVTIPDSITSIGRQAFYCCRLLRASRFPQA